MSIPDFAGDFTLDELRTYARCSLEWFWEKRAGLARPRTVEALTAEALRAALALYYAGHAQSLGQATGLVWLDWCEGWGDAAIAANLSRYAEGRAKILSRITRPDGSAYAAPQLTNLYREQMLQEGLTRLGRRLDDFALSQGLLAPEAERRPGSVLGDAYTDCLLSAERMAQNRETPLPTPGVVLGCDVPYQVELENGMRLTSFADLVTEVGEGSVIVEAHDYQASSWVRASWAGRDIRVIAASHARPPANDGEKRLSWKNVERVIYRHWPSGQAYTFREVNPGHLLAVVTTVARGMRNHVFLPRALTGYDACRGCAYHGQCWAEDGWDTLHLIDAGILGQAEQLRSRMRRLHEAVGSDQQTARRVLNVIQEALLWSPFDAVNMEFTLKETQHALEIVLDERQNPRVGN